MSASPSNENRVVKRGVILTCYVDGRKRFKAVPVDDDRQDLKEKPVVSVRRPARRSTAVRTRNSANELGRR